MADKVHGLDINGDRWELQDLPLTEQVALLQNEVNQLKQAVDYSETEHLTGRKWIDGKPTYEATFTATVNTSPVSVQTGITNVDIVVKVQATRRRDSDKRWMGTDYTAPLQYPAIANNYTHVDFNPNSGILNFYTGSDGYRGFATCTIEYTKTT